MQRGKGRERTRVVARFDHLGVRDIERPEREQHARRQLAFESHCAWFEKGFRRNFLMALNALDKDALADLVAALLDLVVAVLPDACLSIAFSSSR